MAWSEITAEDVWPSKVDVDPVEEVRFLKLHADAIIPTKGTEYSAGFDLYSLENVHIKPMYGHTLVPTGIAVQLPEGTYGRIAMRSGLAVKQHLTVGAGVIDLDYTGPIGVVVGCSKLFENSEKHGLVHHNGYVIKKGERFAQLIVERACYARGVEVTKFDRRYEKHEGFGSTGK